MPIPARRLLLALVTVALSLSNGTSRGEPPGDGDAPRDDFAGRPIAGSGPHASPPAGDDTGPATPAVPAAAVVARFTRPSLPAVASDHVIVRFESDLPVWQRRQIAAAGGGTNFKLAHSGAFARVGVAGTDTPQTLAGRLAGLPGVLSAELDPLAWPLAGTVSKATPTDPQIFFQWWFDRIRLPQALDSNTTGGDGVIVAVIDSGVAFGDGAAFPARRGVDLGATRFLPGLDLVAGGAPFDRGVGIGDDPSAPRFGHGTFVAAQIAAAANNGIAGAGIAPRVTILPIRVIGEDNFGFFSDVADGIDFAVAQGARVINLSLGGPQGPEFLRQAVERADRAGVVIVAAAGNEASDPDAPDDVSFPARYPQVIAVGSTSFADRRASYSNFGPGLDLMAPAGDDASFVDGQRRDAALAPSFLFDPVTGQAVYASFWATGTSFAAPQVAGVAALLIALDVRDPEAVRALLEGTARDLEARGLDSSTAHGLLDVAAAHEGLGIAF